MLKNDGWKLPKSGERWLSRQLKLLGPKQTQSKEDFTETHYNKTSKNQKNREF